MVERMSSVPIFMPYRNGVPRRTNCVNTSPARHSAFPNAIAPATVIGPPPPVLGDGR